MILLRDYWKRLSMNFLAVCFANAPFWIIGGVVFINRPLFSYETIIALIVSIFNKPIGFFLILAAWIVDGLVSQSLTYQFLTPNEFLQSARFSGNIDWQSFITYWHVIGMMVFLIFLCFLYTTSRRISNSAKSVADLIIIGIFLFVFDATNGASDIWRRDKMIMPVNIAGSPAFNLARSSLRSPEKHMLRQIVSDQSISKKFDIVAWASAHPDRSILFVVVESLGVPKSDDALQFLQQYVHINNYNTNFYQIEFRGATTNGELRSLCGLEGSYKAMTDSTGKNCLPAQLARLGWHTSGFHGFSKQMFDRQSWWPKIGVDQLFFIENQEVASLNRCGNVFRGACDKDLLDVAVSHISSPKSFAYVLTLNTHLPVVPVELPNTLSESCHIQGLPDGACMHIAALKNVLEGIVTSASSLPYHPLIVIVGDHAPPFSAISERDVFRQDVVPGFVLVPEL